MFSNIKEDFKQGFVSSLRIDLLFIAAKNNLKLRKLLWKIFIYNFLLHILPLILMQGLFQTIICKAINLFSMGFHLLHYMDLINVVAKYSNKTPESESISSVELISLSITMAIYQSIMYFTTKIIEFIFSGNIYIVGLLVNFFILNLYHSFYFFNNLYQYKKIEIFNRIDLYEKLWPYYMGFGMISSLIYLMNPQFWLLALYNIVVCVQITIPFLIKMKYPPPVAVYEKINLRMFSYLMGRSLDLCGFVLNIL